MNNWSEGIIGIPTKDGKTIKAKYAVKHFEEGSEYGINGGKISKLSITIDGKIAVNYDRGWDVKPKTEEERVALQILLNDYN